MGSIEEKVTAFRIWLISNKHREKTYSNMVSQIDKDAIQNNLNI
jgi:hypothetical protein